MAGGLPRVSSEFKHIPGAKLAVIASMWYAPCVDRMITRAVAELTKIGVKRSDIQIHRIPGSIELPFAARLLFERDSSLDGILAFGVVVKGGTTHDHAVIQSVINGFALVTDRFGKPIINEVIGVTDLKDAEERSGDNDRNKGVEAVFAISELLSWQRSLNSAAR